MNPSPRRKYLFHLSFRSPWLWGLGVALCYLLSLPFTPSPPPCFAESTLKFEVRLSQQDSLTTAEVVSAGKVILALTAQDPKLAQERAQLVGERLQALAADGYDGQSFSLAHQAGWPVILCHSQLVVAFEGPQGKSPTPDPDEILAVWLKNLQSVFARPYFSLPTASVEAKVGERVELPIRGPGLPQLQTSVVPPTIAEASLDKGQGLLALTGKFPGSGQVHLTAGNEALSLELAVTPSNPQPLNASETLSAEDPALLATEPPLVLWFSNDPENVRRPMPLFHAQVPGNASARLFYHHKSLYDGTMKFALWISNPDPTSSQRVYIIQGTSLPHWDAPSAGRSAIVSFYSNFLARQGVIYTLQPGEFRLVAENLWPLRTTIGGLLHFRSLSGGILDVYLEAIPSNVQSLRPDPSVLFSPLSKEWLFPGQRTLTLSHVVGGQSLPLLLGVPGERGLVSPRFLRGSYGIEYKLKITVSNPSNDPRIVRLKCTAVGGGYAHFVGLLDGRLVTASLMRPQESAVLRTFSLQPGQTLTSSLLTTTVGGCYYPLMLSLEEPD